MKTHYLINAETLALATESPDGVHPITRAVGDPTKFTAPEGYAYVSDVDQPPYDASTETIERDVKADEYGWIKRNLTAKEITARRPVAKTPFPVGVGTIEERLTRLERAMPIL